MPNTVTNVSAGKPKIGGAVSIAPLGTALPTDATTALASGYQSLGYVSEDGVTNSNSPDSDTLKAWGGDVVLTFLNSKEDTFTLTFIEALNTNVLKLVYGDGNVTGDLTNGISITANSEEVDEVVMVIDMILRNGVLKRIVIPDAKMSELGDIVYADEEAIGYETTMQAMPDSAGNTHYEYIKAA